MTLKPTIKTAFCALAMIMITHNTTMAGQNKFIGIGLSKAQIKVPTLKAQIRKMALKKGVRLTKNEINRAARQAVNKFGVKESGPSKLIVMVSIRNFTICVSTGPDKNFCKKRKKK